MIKEDLKKIREELIKLDDKRKFKDILPKRSCYQEIYEVNKNKLNDTAICYMNSVITFKQLFSKIYYTTLLGCLVFRLLFHTKR